VTYAGSPVKSTVDYSRLKSQLRWKWVQTFLAIDISLYRYKSFLEGVQNFIHCLFESNMAANPPPPKKIH